MDNNFATNKWVYLYHSPLRMDGVSEITGKPFPAETPPGNAPTTGPDLATFDPWMGYFQLSRFKFVDTVGDVAAHLDLASEQKIMRVEVDRGACCHVADPLGGMQAANQLDAGDWLLLNNRYSFDNMDKQITIRFASNQPAGTLRGLLDMRVDAVDGPVIATCELRATGANGVYQSTVCPFTGTVSGSHRVYLTFRQAPGGPATGFGLLNWVEFSGPGL